MKNESIYDKRIELIEKYGDLDNKPSDKELEEAYGYLSYCIGCGMKFKFAEPHQHSIVGNCHKFGCSIFSRGLGYLYLIIKIITIPIWLPILFILLILFSVYD